MSKISIVLPTFNRARFLKQSINAIKNQTVQDWELIIVDDGSTDNTSDVLESLLLEMKNPVQVIQQKNQGPAEARNSGIKQATGEYVAFYDSDDVWLSDHLENCLGILTQHKEIDWIYTACRRVDLESGKIFDDNSFYNNDVPKALFSLQSEAHDDLYIIKDPKAAQVSISEGIESCFQASVVKRSLFEKIQIPKFRVGEDRLFITMALKAGYTLAFNDRVSVIYNVHDENISDTNPNADIEKRLQANERLVDSYLLTFDYVKNLTRTEKRILNQKIADEIFWTIGYSLLWQHGLKTRAFRAYIRALRLTPLNIRFWKTFFASLMKALLKA